MSDALLLIPSARIVAPELLPEFGAVPSALIPLDGRTALEYIAAAHPQPGTSIRVAGHEAINRLRAFLERRPDLPADLVDVGPTRSLGETILRALGTEPLPAHLTVHFGDTLVPDDLPTGDAVLYVDQRDIYRWTTFELDADARIRRIVDKEQAKDGSAPLHVFVGVFGFAEPEQFRTALLRAVGAPASGIDPFYAALQAYVADRPDRHAIFRPARTWRDLGHLDTYYASKRSHFLGRRYFNDVSVDARRGVIRKTSTQTRKFRDEINWYVRLPRELAYLAPRVIDYRSEGDAPFIELEFYGYPTLNDLFLHGDVSAGVWDQILEALAHVLEAFAAYRLVPSESDALRDAMREMYSVKTRDRLAQLGADAAFEPFLQEQVRINGLTVAGLPVVLAQLDTTAERIGLYHAPHFSLIHGDLCLSNILYDRRHGIVRLIDPRGGFGRFDLYGDPRYDLAKLSHSVLGHYDFIVNGQFSCTASGNDVVLRIHDEPSHRVLRARFVERLLGRDAAHLRQVRLVEALLFLSMIPLHADRPAAQRAFLARGLTLFAAMSRDGTHAEYAAA
jgi:hypothetical protein